MEYWNISFHFVNFRCTIDTNPFRDRFWGKKKRWRNSARSISLLEIRNKRKSEKTDRKSKDPWKLLQNPYSKR